NRSRRRQSAHFSSIIGVSAPTAVGGYDFLKPPWNTIESAFFLYPKSPASGILRAAKRCVSAAH
ncbi:MAG: hypothetical protein WCT12_14255, partial [Verrucomicrobiota bacterium]